MDGMKYPWDTLSSRSDDAVGVEEPSYWGDGQPPGEDADDASAIAMDKMGWMSDYTYMEGTMQP